jgi:ParB-like chromosome segregation protein Spo0J
MNQIKLKPVKQIEINKLKSNPLNAKFFKPTDGANTDWLFNDIKKRGIIVPLIALKNGILLAGHRRLFIAKQLNLTTVPVQYIENNLNIEQQKQFLVKDNVLRRHLTPNERVYLYRFLIPDFDEKLELINSKSLGINQTKLADESGLNPKTVGYDLAMLRRKAKKNRNIDSEIDLPDEKAIHAYKKACAHMLNIAILGSKNTLDNFKQIHQTTTERLNGITH